MKKILWIGLMCCAAVVARTEVTVTNLVVAQRPGTKLVDITYDVSSTEANVVTVSLSVSNGTEAVSCPSVWDDVGAGVAMGTGKTIVWNMGADWNGNIASLMFGIQADAGVSVPAIPEGMVKIPGGTNSGTDPDFGDYSLTVDAFYMDATEVTKAQWDTVYNWAVANGYSFDNTGLGKASSHPVHSVNCYDCIKWCNARSEMDDRTPCYNLNDWSCDVSANGYRLPTTTEWEYAARGGLSGKRFPWGDTITHSEANYDSDEYDSYDISPTRGKHPDYDDGGFPYTSPVGSFAANEYGLYDMAGNVDEWCDTASGGSYQQIRGGSWVGGGWVARCGFENWQPASYVYDIYGFRAVCRDKTVRSVVSISDVLVDSRDYVLTVSSAHGSPTPAVGVHSNYCWQSAVICSVDSVVSESGTNYTSTGWSGIGSVPATGTTNTTDEIILTNLSSSITWNWEEITTIHEVTFDLGFYGTYAGGGSLTQQVQYGHAAVAPSVTTPSGIALAGWDTDFGNVTSNLAVTAQYMGVANLHVTQRSGTKLVDITYDLFSDATNAIIVSLAVSNGLSEVNATSLTGDVGSLVTAGTGKTFIWDMGADWDGNAAMLLYTVSADDGALSGSLVPEGFVMVEAGTAAGGSPTISKDFYIAKYEVTKSLWEEVAGWADDNGYDISPSNGGGSGNYPVVSVSWYQCVKWCNAWSEKTGRPPAYRVNGAIYRTGNQDNVDCDFNAGGGHLPSDVQWEYAARGGKDGNDTLFSGSDTIDDVAWYSDNSVGRSREVGTLEANELGTFDMSGNVLEWCHDWYPGDEGSSRILRGGDWYHIYVPCSVSYRSKFAPFFGLEYYGFRPTVPAVQSSGGAPVSVSAGLFSDARDYTLTNSVLSVVRMRCALPSPDGWDAHDG